MPGDPFKTKPHSGKKGLAKTKPSAPKSVPSGRSKGPKSQFGGPGGRKDAGKTTLIGQPSVTRTPHIQKRSQLPKGKQGAYVGPTRGGRKR